MPSLKIFPMMVRSVRQSSAVGHCCFWGSKMLHAPSVPDA
jgi:hypothetical protein